MGVIDDLAAEAAVVLVVEGSDYVVRAKRPKRAKILRRVAERAEINDLAKLLAVPDGITDYAWMTQPTRTFVFMTDDNVLGQFGHFDGWLRSESWPGGDRSLINAADLTTWLATTVDPPT